MLKEIMEQPEVLENCMRGRLHPDDGLIQMDGLTTHLPRILAAPRIIIVACGTSWHAGLVGEYLIEHLARVPVEVSDAQSHHTEHSGKRTCTQPSCLGYTPAEDDSFSSRSS